MKEMSIIDILYIDADTPHFRKCAEIFFADLVSNALWGQQVVEMSIMPEVNERHEKITREFGPMKEKRAR